MNEYNCEDFIISTMRWSFSRLNSFDNGCRYEWYKHYIECEPSKQGFFGAYGNFCHTCLEKYAKGELDIFDISPYYEDHFVENVPYDAPPNKYTDIKQDYYDKGLSYFDNIDLPLDKYKVLGVEKRVDFSIDKYPFIGFIDLLLQDPVDGKLILCDHKSASIKKKRDGSISKSDEKHFLEFRRQQYLYSKAVMEEFGDGSIKSLWWNMFKDQDWIKIPFDNNDYNEALTWALDTIHRIETESKWLPSKEYIKAYENGKGLPFYCSYICGQSDECKYRMLLISEKDILI